jgi:GrpB-like predicted nucleotidyltransferase (UPF0157 family)
MAQRRVEVAAYDAKWAELYEAEAERLRGVFGNLLVEILHIGSTAVPGLAAKPVIDIMPLVTAIEQVDALNPAMEKLDYLPKGEAGIRGRRLFIKPSDVVRTHHVHVFQWGDPEGIRHLAFREFLKVHPELVEEYGNLKTRLAQQFPFDIHAYMDGKDEWVQRVEKQAVIWYAQQQRTS